ncbi:MAG: Lrp/AsnC family transcriptional regulator [Gammaproteobacteria bacterium]|nr:Lrp/AsnC family transcriptional regulator [Gammaproteobacteria bacterium]
MKLDPTERRILRLLQTDGRMSNVALAERIGLSESPCHRRVRQLEEGGVIQGYCRTGGSAPTRSGGDRLSSR